MLSKQFEVEGVVGIVRRFNPRGGEMDKARYMKALGAIYPGLSAAITNVMGDVETMMRGGSVVTFAAIATQIAEIAGLPFEWPTPSSPPEDIDKAYQHYLYECPDVWDEITRLCAEVNNPNGKVGALWESLTDDEKKILKSLMDADAGGQNSGQNSG